MALIICPECGKQVSDQSEQCVYCGYPIKQNTNCTINGIKFDLGFLLDDKIEYGTKCRMFALQHGCEIGQSRYYIDKIIETGIIPKTLTVKTVDDVIKEQETLKPHCPTCGSTDIQKISGTKRWLSTGLFGLASSDIGKSMCCKKCGYKW